MKKRLFFWCCGMFFGGIQSVFASAEVEAMVQQSRALMETYREEAKQIVDQAQAPSVSPEGCGQGCSKKAFLHHVHAEKSPASPGQLLVLISFSMPDEALLALAPVVSLLKGRFVLRGLYENSFLKTAQKMQALKQKGFKAKMDIDPALFGTYDVQQVPCFVVLDKGHFDKMTGNTTVEYALEKMAQSGETAAAKSLWDQWKQRRR